MQTVIITGVSGAGKTQAIDYLEDFGYFCIDNMPIQLLPKFLDLCRSSDQEKVAVVTDIRSVALQKDKPEFREFYKLKQDPETTILYLDANDQAIVKRYQQTRRRHPLVLKTGSLEKAIKQERTTMQEMKDLADQIIDTSDLKPTDLYETLRDYFNKEEEADTFLINIISFGFKYGAPRSADFVFDTRFLMNPFWVPELRDKTGEDQEVRDFVMSNKEAQKYMDYIVDLLTLTIPFYLNVDKNHITVAFGCTGGQHRSVTFAHQLAEAFRDKGYIVQLDHRDILKDRFS